MPNAESVVKGCLFVVGLGTVIGIIMPKDDEKFHATTWYPYISSILGYIYTVAWSISFYPQVLLNYRRKDTTGLSINYVLLLMIGAVCYATYNSCFFWSNTIQEAYMERHDGMINLVQSNDVAFALHAVALSIWMFGQIVYYDGFWKRIPSVFTMMVLGLLATVCCLYVVLILLNEAGILPSSQQTSSVVKFLNWLNFLYFLSMIEIFMSITCYIPQMVLNFRRKSTQGWNIWNIILDLMGGVCSILQLVFDSWNRNDWSGIYGNFSKLSIGFVSIFFDVIFIIQHYVLYPPPPRDIDYAQLKYVWVPARKITET